MLKKFGIMRNVLYICLVKLQTIWYITNEEMKDLLQKISVLDYLTFRERAIKECCWTKLQYQERRNGRIKLRPLERKIIENIINDINQQNQTTCKES